MKKLLLILLFLPMIGFGQMIFDVINHPKSKGLNFSIKEPVDFQRTDSKNNDIVYTWMKGKEMMININIKEMPGFDYTKNECIQMMQDENILENFADMVNAEKAEYIIIDSYPGFKTQYYLGGYYNKSISLFINDKMFTLSMLTGKESKLDIYKEDFLQMANSLVFYK